MKPGRHDVTVPREQSYALVFTYKLDGLPADVTGKKVQLEVRANRYDDVVLLEVTNFADDTAISLGGSSGTGRGMVTINVTEEQIAELGSARALWYTVRLGDTETSVQAIFAGVFSLEDW